MVMMSGQTPSCALTNIAPAPHPAHQLVGDQEHAMPVADLADAGEIVGNGSDAAKRRRDDRLGNEGHDALRTEPPDFGVELVGGTQAVSLFRLACVLVAIGVAGCNLRG